MNEQKISHDDPKLTAYALGELSGEERAAIETLLKGDPAAQAAVDEIRALATQLEGALATEPLTELPVDVSAKVSRAAAGVADDPYRKKVIRFPYVWVGTLAAACFALVVALRDDRPAQLAEHKATDKQATEAVSGVAGSEATSSSTSGNADAPSLARKRAGTFSVDGPSVLLVKDAEEFAAIPAPEVPAMKTKTDASLSASGQTVVSASAFAAAPEPIKTSITYQDPTPAITGTVGSASAKPVDPVVLAENIPAPPATSALEGETFVASEEVVLLNAFVVSSAREGGSYAGAVFSTNKYWEF